MKTVLIVFACLAAFSAVVTFLYLAIYSHIINSRLSGEKRKKRALPLPRTILAIMIAITCVATMCSFAALEENGRVEQVIEVRSIGGLSANEYEIRNSERLSRFNREENENYTKQSVLSDGDFTCSVFLRNTGVPFDDNPYYLIYIYNDGLGSENLLYGYKAEYELYNPSTERVEKHEFREFSQKADEATDTILFFGDATNDCVMTITMYYFNREAYESTGAQEYTEVLDTAVKTVTFSFPVKGWHF